jgi:hypothetical protein
MSKIFVDLSQSNQTDSAPAQNKSRQPYQSYNYSPNQPLEPKKKRNGLFLKILLGLAAVLLLVGVIAVIGGYLYWQSLQKSPAYSLALLVDAARKDNKPEIEKYLDIDTVVDDFVPQVMAKATERYGRGLPPDLIKKATQYLQPLLPEVKNIARRKIPEIIKEKAQIAPDVSPWIMAIGIGRVVDIQENGDEAIVKANLQNRPIELTMKRNGDRWKIIKVKDDALADRIAEEMGKKIQAIIGNKINDITKLPKGTIEDLKNQMGDIFPQ